MALHEIGDLQEQKLALIGLKPAPRPVEGAAGSGNRQVDILGIGLRHGADHRPGGGIAGLEGAPACGIAPFAVDQHLAMPAVDGDAQG